MASLRNTTGPIVMFILLLCIYGNLGEEVDIAPLPALVTGDGLSVIPSIAIISAAVASLAYIWLQ